MARRGLEEGGPEQRVAGNRADQLRVRAADVTAGPGRLRSHRRRSASLRRGAVSPHPPTRLRVRRWRQCAAHSRRRGRARCRQDECCRGRGR
jgi:hypothetical protein